MHFKENVQTSLRTYVDEDDMFVISMEEREVVDGIPSKEADVMEIALDDGTVRALAIIARGFIDSKLSESREVTLVAPDGSEISIGVEYDEYGKYVCYYLTLTEKDYCDTDGFPYMTAKFRSVFGFTKSDHLPEEAVTFITPGSFLQFVDELEIYCRMVIEARIGRDLEMNSRESMIKAMNLVDGSLTDEDFDKAEFNELPKVEEIMK